MKNIFKAAAIGAVAGVLDVIPMLVQGIGMVANVSAFVHWLVLGLIIPFVSWKLKPWLRGMVIGEISAIPIMLIVAQKEPESVVPIAVASLILGVLIAVVGDRYIHAESN